MANKSTKIKKATAVCDSKAKPTRMIEDWLDFRDNRKKPMSEAGITRFANEMVDWAMKNKKALKISQFYLSKGVHPKTYYKWKVDWPVIQRAHEIALLAIGNRREIGALTRRYEPSFIKQMMAHYDYEWREEEDRKREADRKVEEERQRPQVVIMKDFPSSSLVPEKKSKQQESVCSATPEEVARKSSCKPYHRIKPDDKS